MADLLSRSFSKRAGWMTSYAVEVTKFSMTRMFHPIKQIICGTVSIPLYLKNIAALIWKGYKETNQILYHLFQLAHNQHTIDCTF